MEFVPKKLYYKIREVCEIADVEAHVLRFWETEFPALAPPKSRTGQRTYRPKDIELILEIRKLLYEEGFTIAGARRRLGMRAPAAASKKQSQERSLRSSGNISESVKPLKPEHLPLFDAVISDETETIGRLDFIEDEADTGSEFVELRELPPPVPVSRPLSSKSHAPGKVEAPPKTDADDSRPTSERLKRVQVELENILTLLDRE